MKCKICHKEFKQSSNSQVYCIECKKRICQWCKKEFTFEPKANKKSKGLFCSLGCYHKARWKSIGKCRQCGKEIGTKAIYCSDRCAKDYWNKNGYNLLTKKRMWARKKELIEKLGGKCIKCGITDIRVLDINHKDPSKKERPKDRQYNWTRRLKEWNKNIGNLELLCSNCHRIHTWKQRNFGV